MATLANRNNNPGNVKDPKTGSFKQFTTPEEGKAALYNDLTAKMTGTSTTGINGDSSLVDFANVYAPASDKNDPIQYAANIANHLKVSPDTKIGSLTPRIDEFADAIQKNEGYSSPESSVPSVSKNQNSVQTSGFNPKPYSNPTQQPNNSSQFNIDTSGSQPSQPTPESKSKIVEGIKGVGNFLFPIVKDVYNDVKEGTLRGGGKSIKQQVGDLALSALPFIPGLGEVGLGAKGAEGAGLLGKLGASATVKGAGVGYGAGVASNLSQGKGILESLKPNTNTILGAVTGGATPGIIEGGSKVLKSLSGIDPQIETQLTKYGVQSEGKDVQLYNKYINAAKTHSGDLEKTSPLTLAANELDTAAKKIQSKVDKAGVAVGQAKEGGATAPLKPLQDVGTEFWKNVQDKYGLNLFTKPNGKVIAKKTAGTMLDTSSTDISRIEKIANQLSVLHQMGEKATAKHASEIIDNLNKLVDFSKADVYGHTNDPLEGLIKHTAGNLNEVIRESNPALAKANDAFSSLKTLQDEITGMAGKTLNKGELLMRRVFSGDKSGEVQDLFGKIKQVSGIDLTKHAVMAKHAIESVGSNADKTLLEKMISGASDSHSGGIFNTAINVGKGIAKKTLANPEKIGRGLIEGKTGSVTKGLITKGAIKGATSIGGVIKK